MSIYAANSTLGQGDFPRHPNPKKSVEYQSITVDQKSRGGIPLLSMKRVKCCSESGLMASTYLERAMMDLDPRAPGLGFWTFCSSNLGSDRHAIVAILVPNCTLSDPWTVRRHSRFGASVHHSAKGWK